MRALEGGKYYWLNVKYIVYIGCEVLYLEVSKELFVTPVDCFLALVAI